MNTLMTSKPVGMAVNSDEGGMGIITKKDVLIISSLAFQSQSFAKNRDLGAQTEAGRD